MKLWLVFGKSPWAAPEEGYGAAICVRDREADHVADNAEPGITTWIRMIEIDDLDPELEAMLKAYLESTEKRETDELELPDDAGATD